MTSREPEVLRLVGRERELEMLHRAFDDAREGLAIAVHVRGQSGIGKTALIRAFTDALPARIRDVVVLHGRCYERESVPYKALDGVVDALSRYMTSLKPAEVAALVPRHAGLLQQVFPVLGSVGAIAELFRPQQKILDPVELRRCAFGALRDLLARLGERHPLVLVIDDLQWADADSLLLLQELMRPPDAPELLLLLASRVAPTRSGGPGARQDSTSLSLNDVRLIGLEPLDAAQAESLAQELLDRAQIQHRVNAAAVASEARGHPLYIAELVRHATLKRREQSGRLDLDEAIWTRIASLDEGAIRLLELVAVVGAPVPQETVRNAAEMRTSTFARHLSLLRVASLIRGAGSRGTDTVEAYHDRVREAVLAHLDESARRQLHARLAVAIEKTGLAAGQPELLLRHLEAAGRTRKAAEYAEEAAQRATKALAFDRAAELYATALRLGDHDEESARALQIKLGGALVNAARGADAAQAFLAAADGADPAIRLECQQRAAEQLLITGHVERGLETLDALLAEVGVRSPRTPRRALLSLLWQRTRLRVRGLRWKEKHESEITRRALIRLDAYKAASHGLGVVDTIRGADFQTRGLLLALRLGERTRVVRSLCMEAAYVSSQGSRALARGRALHREAHQIAEGRGDPYLDALLGFTDGLLCYFEGRLAAATARLLDAERELRRRTVGATFELNNTRLFRMFALRFMGAFGQLRDDYEQYVGDARRRGDQYAEASMLSFCNIVWLVDDDISAARKELEKMSWVPPEGRFHLQHWFQLVAVGELALYRRAPLEGLLEFRSKLADIRRSFLLRVQVVRVITLRLWGRLALAAAAAGHDRERSLAEAKRMAGRIERERYAHTTTWAQLLRAGIAEVEGNPTGAMTILRELLSSPAAAEVAVTVAVAKRRLGELLGGAEGEALIRESDAWMTQEAVQNPEGLTEEEAPGFAVAVEPGGRTG